MYQMMQQELWVRRHVSCDGAAHLWLAVVLQAHGDHIDADDEGDEEVQIVTGAERVNHQTDAPVRSVIRQPLGLCTQRMVIFIKFIITGIFISPSSFPALIFKEACLRHKMKDKLFIS